MAGLGGLGTRPGGGGLVLHVYCIHEICSSLHVIPSYLHDVIYGSKHVLNLFWGFSKSPFILYIEQENHVCVFKYY
jgi:hypothetical protein